MSHIKLRRRLDGKRLVRTYGKLCAAAGAADAVGWAVTRTCSGASPTMVALDRLETLVRNRLKRLRYRPGPLDGFLAGTV
ncbi:hypothetical protein ACIQB5_24385 [Streptomyces sp. NPDC088560]|uniref:hypothetical protein n=1 Tax=Streptomyces sp. NPDC088560 TaxID=3365868 RepID=UPI0038302054